MSVARAEFPEKLEFLFEPRRYKVLHGGRGGAKSWGIARALLILGAQKPLRILCTREYQNSIKDSVHQLLSDQIEDLGLKHFYQILNHEIVGINGTSFAFEGLKQNINNMKSFEGADIVWVEEATPISRRAWDILVPTIRKDGSEIWVSFNPEFEDDETYLRFITNPPRNSKVIEINWRDNPWFPNVLRDEKDEMQARDIDRYEHIWEGKCLRWLEGSIYAKELRKAYADERITTVEFEPEVPVYTAWDLGHTDDTAIWWYQIVHGEIHVLECYASNGGSLSEYASQILARQVEIDLVGDDVIATLGNWIPDISYRRAYRYGQHWLPHDARAKTLAAKGKSIIQQLMPALKSDKLAIVPEIGVEDGIQAARMMFPRVWMDTDGCADGLKALRRYQRKLADDEKSFGKSPLHDWTSHYADAFRMMAVAWTHEPAAKPAPEQPRGIMVGPANKVTLDDMWKSAPRRSERI